VLTLNARVAGDPGRFHVHDDPLEYDYQWLREMDAAPCCN